MSLLSTVKRDLQISEKPTFFVASFSKPRNKDLSLTKNKIFVLLSQLEKKATFLKFCISGYGKFVFTIIEKLALLMLKTYFRQVESFSFFGLPYADFCRKKQSHTCSYPSSCFSMNG